MKYRIHDEVCSRCGSENIILDPLLQSSWYNNYWRRKMNKYTTIFDYSQKELSQDAFLAWLFQFADGSIRNDYLKQSSQTESEVQKIGECATSILRLFTGWANLNPSTICIYKQWEHIDLWVSIDNKYSIIIEDKISTSEHNDQLSRYKAIAEKWCGENNQELFCCYYKTESFPLKERKTVESKGYVVFERKDILTILDGYIDFLKTNEIIASYYQFLKNKEEQENLFCKLRIREWEWYQHVGFMKTIDSFFSDDQDLNWGYVNNPSGGFCGLWWHFRPWKDYTVYLQFEDHKLCVKIGEVYENHFEAREYAVEKMNSLAELEGIRINKPPRYGTGTYMTIGIIDEQYWLTEKADGSIDLMETKKKLEKLMLFIDELSRQN